MKKERDFKVESLVWQPVKEAGPILKGLSFQMPPGHFYGILGANGSGKTSLLRHLLRLVDSKNSVFLERRAIESWMRKELARKLSYVPQNTACSADFTVEEFVMLGRFPHQGRWAVETAEDVHFVEEALKKTNCISLRSQKVQTLSGGEMQRVAAARAIAQGTEWMFLDEPVSQLDIRHQLELMDILHELCMEKRNTIVCVLHDINLALRYCDRVLLLKDGKLCSIGETQEVISCSRLKEIYGVNFEELFRSNGERYMVPEPLDERSI